LVGMFLLVEIGAARPAHALDKNIKTVFIAGGYGLLAGTAVGLITLPLTQGIWALFIGSSVGLYLGIVIGVFHVLNRENPQNPLRPQAQMEPYRLAMRDREERTGPGGWSARGEGWDGKSILRPPRPAFELSVPVLRF